MLTLDVADGMINSGAGGIVVGLIILIGCGIYYAAKKKQNQRRKTWKANHF